MGDRGRKLVQLACNSTMKTYNNATVLSSNIHSNSSSDMEDTQKEIAEEMNKYIDLDVTMYDPGPSTSTKKIINVIENSTDDEVCLFGSDYSDIDPTYVPDSVLCSPKSTNSIISFGMIVPESPLTFSNDFEPQKELIIMPILENILDRVWFVVKPLKRRKRAQPSEWKKNINKARKIQGLSYITKGVCRPAKLPKPIDCNKCKFKCTENFSLAERNTLCRNFYEMDFKTKKNFILACVELQPVKTRKLNKTSNKKDRVYSKKCFFKKGDNRMQVCQKFFLSTLCISVDVITDAVSKMDSVGMYNEDDRRGRKIPPNKTNTDDVQSIKDHIESFPVMESHYCRRDTKKKYLAPDIKSIKHMYRLYKEKCEETKKPVVSEFVYRKTFNENYNFSFFSPKKDICSLCEKYSKAECKVSLEQEYQEHIQRKTVCQAAKDADKLRASSDETFMSITMDLQAVLQIPSGGVSILYYLRKLVLYNFTIYEARLPNNAYCHCWSEINGKKGSCEIGTCLFYYLSEQIPKTVKEISIFSDTCSGQNRNQHVSALLLWAVQKLDHLQIIEQKFLESGHTHMEVDSMHAAIEHAARNLSINSVHEWKNIFLKARKKKTKMITTEEGKKKNIEIDNYRVKEFKYNEMLDLKKLSASLLKNKNRDNLKQTVNWLKIKRIRYVKGDLKLFFNYDMSENFRYIDVLNINTPKTRATRSSNPPSVNMQLVDELDSLYDSQLPISVPKKRDLLDLCKKLIIPEELHGWIENMKTPDHKNTVESDKE